MNLDFRNTLSIIQNSTVNSTKSERFLTQYRNFGLTRFEGDLTNHTRNNLDCVNGVVLPILAQNVLAISSRSKFGGKSRKSTTTVLVRAIGVRQQRRKITKGKAAGQHFPHSFSHVLPCEESARCVSSNKDKSEDMLCRHSKTLRRLWRQAAPLMLMDVSETAMAKNNDIFCFKNFIHKINSTKDYLQSQITEQHESLQLTITYGSSRKIKS